MKRTISAIVLFSVVLLMFTGCTNKEQVITAHYAEIDLSDFEDGFHHARFLYPDELPPWDLYDADQILAIAENILAFQNDDGGWPKNIDYQRIYTHRELMAVDTSGIEPSTLDNRNTYAQIRYLCRVWEQAKSLSELAPERYLNSALEGIRWILSVQHPENGGFTGYHVDAITFNDEVMTGTLRLLRDIANGTECFSAVPSELRGMAQAAYDRGIDCILETQISVTLPDGSVLLTAWCQQHSNEKPFVPVWARSFEPPSICSWESFEVLKLLMEIPEPDERVIQAVRAGCAFFSRNDVRISGKRIEIVETEPIVLNDRVYTTDRFMVDDPDARDMWARFYALDESFDIVSGATYEIKGNYPSVLDPIWCDRECQFVEEYNLLSRERRNGYDYVTFAGDWVLKIYEEWEKNISQ